MRILNVFPAYEPAWAFGGVVRCTSSLCRALAQAGADVSVYTTNVDGQGGLLDAPVGEPVDIGGVKTTYFPSTFGGNSVWDSRELSRALDETIGDFDLLYVSAVYQWLGISAGRLARQRGIPYVVGCHGSFHPATLERGRLKKWLYWQLFLKQSIGAASALHFTTEYERNVSAGQLPGVESFVVPNTVPMAQAADAQPPDLNLRDKHGLDDEAPLLLTVVRPDPAKRLDILLNSFAKIAEQLPAARLLVVGPDDNAHVARMKRLADQLGVSGKTVWLGYQSGEALAACYRQSDLFLLASEHENFSMVTVEAMAAGLPVIISEHVGLADDVRKHKAGIVAGLDAEEFARAALELLGDDARLRELGQRARETALELYRGEQVARLMLRAFEDVANGQRAEECRWQ